MSDPLKTGLAGLLAVVALVLLVLSVHSVKSDEDAVLDLRPAAQAQSAPDFTLPEAATGRAVHLQAETSARPVVLDFWATWCGPCRQELPHLSAVAKKYAGRVAFYGVNSHDTSANIVAFARQFGMTFPTLRDPDQKVAAAYGADALPTLVIIDRQGRIRVFSQGYDPGADIEGALSKILNGLTAGN